MAQPSEIVNQNLYQLPACSICLNQLTHDMASLSCGHIFHIDCITQHFQYKGTCPNCQKRAMEKEIRLVVFPVLKNNKTGDYLRSLLSGIEKSEGQQVQGLLMEIKRLSERSCKVEREVKDLETDLRRKKEECQKNTREIESKNSQIALLRKDNSLLRKQNNELKNQNQRKALDLEDIRQSYYRLQQQRKQIEQFKLMQKLAAENSEQLIKYKTELENQKTQPEAMAKIFFEMLQVKNLSMLKTKEKQKQYADKYRYKEEENMKHKSQINMLKKQMQQSHDEISRLKVKIDKWKKKCRQLIQQSKSKQDKAGVELNQIEQNSLSLSFGFANKIGQKSHASIAPQKAQKVELRQPTFNIMQKPKAAQPKLTFGAPAMKKSAIEEKKPITLKKFFA